jgi:hypothetical protein
MQTPHGRLVRAVERVDHRDQSSMANIEIKKQGYELARPLQMVGMAKVLKRHIVRQQLYTNIQGKNYAHVEGWQFAGGLLGMFPRVAAVENLSNCPYRKLYPAGIKLRIGRCSASWGICSN